MNASGGAFRNGFRNELETVAAYAIAKKVVLASQNRKPGMAVLVIGRSEG